MKCCKNKNSDKHSNHSWMMIICCFAPIILLAMSLLLGSGNNEVKALLVGIVPFVCPIMMIIMLPMMLADKRVKDNQSKDECTEKLDERG